MRANGALGVSAMMLMALGVGCGNPGYARAEENCLPAPNARAPQGSHWFFHTDRTTQRKCWSLKKEGEAANTDTVSGATPTGAKIKSGQPVARQAPDAPSDTTRLRGSVVQEKPNNDVGHRAEGQNTVWPAPSSPAAPNNFAWPEPHASPQNATPDGADASSSVAGASPGSATNNMPATTTQLKEESSGDAHPEKEDESNFMSGAAGSARRITLYGRIPVGIIFVVAFGLVVAGIFVRRTLIKALYRRRAAGHGQENWDRMPSARGSVKNLKE